MGVPPHLMPLAIGVVAATLATGLLFLVNRVPGPSSKDIAAKAKRNPMSLKDGCGLVRRWIWCLGPMLVAYALLTGLRSFRDLYSVALFSAALNVTNGTAVDPSVFLTVDIPGALLACAAMFMVNYVKDNRRVRAGRGVRGARGVGSARKGGDCGEQGGVLLRGARGGGRRRCVFVCGLCPWSV